MANKNDDGKIKGVKSTDKTSEVEKTKQVGSVKGVKATSSIGAIGGVTSVGGRRKTRTMTLEEREEIFRLINEEADKIFANSGLPKEKRDLVQNAVKMAVDSGLVDKENSEEGESGKKKPTKGGK